MSWIKKDGSEHDHIDGRTGIHHIRLHNPVTDGEHHLLIGLGLEACGACGRPFRKSGEAHDPSKVTEDALAMLRANHEAVVAYAERHGVPLKVAGPVDGYRVVKVKGAHYAVSARLA